MVPLDIVIITEHTAQHYSAEGVTVKRVGTRGRRLQTVFAIFGGMK